MFARKIVFICYHTTLLTFEFNLDSSYLILSELDQRLSNMKTILSKMPEANLTVAKILLYVLIKVSIYCN